jgi:hypothetical protein
VSIVGVYGGQVDPMPMMDLFDKGIQLRMGQAHVRRWTDEILPVLLADGDVLGTEDLCTHPLPLEQAPHGYEIFQQKRDGAIKVVLKPGQRPGPAEAGAGAGGGGAGGAAGPAGASPGTGGAAGAGGASGPGSEGGPVRSR